MGVIAGQAKSSPRVTGEVDRLHRDMLPGSDAIREDTVDFVEGQGGCYCPGGSATKFGTSATFWV